MRLIVERVLAGAITLLLLMAADALADVEAMNLNYTVKLTLLHLGKDPRDAKAGMELPITYNSRTLHRGMFGFGWCTDIESKLQLQQDGGLLFTDCGAGTEHRFRQNGGFRVNRDQISELLVSSLRRTNPEQGEENLLELQRDLKLNSPLFDDLARNTRLPLGALLPGSYAGSPGFSARVGPDLTVEIQHANGTKYLFGRELQLYRIEYPSGEFVAIERSADRVRLTTPAGSFELLTRTDTVMTVLANGKQIASFAYLDNKFGRALVAATDAWGKRYKFRYDDMMNLLRLNYPDGTTEEVQYDTESDWVLALKDRSGCKQTVATEDWPINQQWRDLLTSEDELRSLTEGTARDLYGTEITNVCNGKVSGRNVFLFAFTVDPVTGRRYMSGYEVIREGRPDDFTLFGVDDRRKKSARFPLPVLFTRSEQSDYEEVIQSRFSTVRYSLKAGCSPLDFSGWMTLRGLPNAFFSGSVTFTNKVIGTGCDVSAVIWNTPEQRLALSVTGKEADRIISIDAINGAEVTRLHQFKPGLDSQHRTYCGVSFSGVPTAGELQRILEAPECPIHERALIRMALVLFPASGPDDRANCGCPNGALKRRENELEVFASQLLRSGLDAAPASGSSPGSRRSPSPSTALR